MLNLMIGALGEVVKSIFIYYIYIDGAKKALTPKMVLVILKS